MNYFLFVLGKSPLGIRVVVEHVSVDDNDSDTPHVTDTYLWIPADTNFDDLVHTVLYKLGYSTAELLNAKGITTHSLKSIILIRI